MVIFMFCDWGTSLKRCYLSQYLKIWVITRSQPSKDERLRLERPGAKVLRWEWPWHFQKPHSLNGCTVHARSLDLILSVLGSHWKVLIRAKLDWVCSRKILLTAAQGKDWGRQVWKQMTRYRWLQYHRWEITMISIGLYSRDENKWTDIGFVWNNDQQILLTHWMFGMRERWIMYNS